MPMFGNQEQPGPGMGGFADSSSPGGMAGNVVGNMFGGQNMSMAGRRGPQGNNFGMGQEPQQMPDHLARLQKQCMSGDGAACNQLQIAQAQWGDHQNQWYQQRANQQDMYNQRTNSPMGARRGW